jgi:hypothetical protein
MQLNELTPADLGALAAGFDVMREGFMDGGAIGAGLYCDKLSADLGAEIKRRIDAIAKGGQ